MQELQSDGQKSFHRSLGWSEKSFAQTSEIVIGFPDNEDKSKMKQAAAFKLGHPLGHPQEL